MTLKMASEDDLTLKMTLAHKAEMSLDTNSFRGTPFTQTIKFHPGMSLLQSNHFLFYRGELQCLSKRCNVQPFGSIRLEY